MIETCRRKARILEFVDKEFYKYFCSITMKFHSSGHTLFGGLSIALLTPNRLLMYQKLKKINQSVHSLTNKLWMYISTDTSNQNHWNANLWSEIGVLWANITHFKSHTTDLGFWLQADTYKPDLSNEVLCILVGQGATQLAALKDSVPMQGIEDKILNWNI